MIAISCSWWTSFTLSLLSLIPSEVRAFSVDPHTLLHLSTPFTSLPPAEFIPQLFHRYQDALQADPLKTQMSTGVVLAVAGDAVAQTTASEEAPYNVNRAVSFAGFDAVYRVAQHYLYPPMIALCQGNILREFVPSFLPVAAVEQALFSQLVIIPLVYYPSFFAVTGMVQGLSPQETIQRAKDSFFPLMSRNLMFWIPVQFGVFAFCPNQDLQIPILIACGLVWTVILSALAGSATKKVARSNLDDIPDEPGTYNSGEELGVLSRATVRLGAKKFVGAEK